MICLTNRKRNPNIEVCRLQRHSIASVPSGPARPTDTHGRPRARAHTYRGAHGSLLEHCATDRSRFMGSAGHGQYWYDEKSNETRNKRKKESRKNHYRMRMRNRQLNTYIYVRHTLFTLLGNCYFIHFLCGESREIISSTRVKDMNETKLLRPI